MMKKALALILTLSLLLGCVSMLSGCGRRISYENGEAYTAGAFESDADIHSIEIYWDGKAVRVTSAFTDKIVAKEDYEEKDEEALHYSIADGVLKIYPCASGERVGDLSKTLLLQLPMAIVDGLRSLKIEAYGDTKVDLQTMKASSLSVVAEDGSVHMDGALSRIYVETVKGDLSVKSATVTELDFVSVVGNANLSLHLQGFIAVMRGEVSEFKTNYEGTDGGTRFDYGTQETILTFDTEGAVSIFDYDIAQ